MKVKSLTPFKFVPNTRRGGRNHSTSGNKSEELSSSSTHTVEHNVYHKKPTDTTRRRVSFQENVDTIAASGEGSSVARRWYSDSECAEMKEEFNFDCKTTVRSIAIVSQHAAHEDQSYCGALNRTYQAICQEGNDQDQDEAIMARHAELAKHLQEGMERLGMEHRLVKRYSKDKKQRRQEQLALLRPRRRKDHKSMSAGAATELLREECERISRPARLFAAAVGHACQ